RGPARPRCSRRARWRAWGARPPDRSCPPGADRAPPGRGGARARRGAGAAAVIPMVRPGTAGAHGVAGARGRFLETITTLRPGAELRAEIRLSARTDPYLTEYLVGGQPVFPV